MNIKYSIVYSKQSARDLKRMIRRGKNVEKFRYVLNELAAGNPLPAKYRDHPLKGQWEGCRDCHIEDDWVLIYRIDKNELILLAMRTGTHADFGW